MLPATRQRWHSCPYPSRSWYSIKRPRRDARLSWQFTFAPQTSAPPWKQLSRTSAPAWVGYGACIWGGGQCWVPTTAGPKGTRVSASPPCFLGLHHVPRPTTELYQHRQRHRPPSLLLLLLTDRRQHLPTRTPTPPHTSAPARVSYGEHVSGEGAHVECRRRPGLLHVNCVSLDI